MLKSGFAFIASHIRIEGSLPVEIAPGHVLRRARDTEVALIREQLRRNAPGPYYQWVDYEADVHPEVQGASTTFRVEPLSKEGWRYWVMAFEPNNHIVHEIEMLGLLVPIDVEFAFQVYFSEADQTGEVVGYVTTPLHIVERYSDFGLATSRAATLSTRQLSSIRELLTLYKDIDSRFMFVRRAIETFAALRRVSMRSELNVVGLFSIIESLITHAPRLTETLDSINHQITNKIVLLRKRYSRPVNVANYFETAGEDKIWKKLYSYRSSIAHGNAVEFSSDFRILRDHGTVVLFLRDNVKELLTLALHEPEFLFDLRSC